MIVIIKFVMKSLYLKSLSLNDSEANSGRFKTDFELEFTHIEVSMTIQ